MRRVNNFQKNTLKAYPELQKRFEAAECCILVPTFNNDKTLENLIRNLLGFTSNVLVVNDGSTDETSEILQKFPDLETLEFTENRGKGAALNEGFKLAGQLGFKYAISIDSDGQHFPEDIIIFLEALEQKPADEEILVIGARKMDHKDIPGKSSIGNKVSSFWFWVETGIKLEDTQCGFRLYPLEMINSLNLSTSKFEFEIEVLVKAAWQGAKISNLPIRVYYPPGERITHFRPFSDVTRIVIFYIKFRFKRIFSSSKKERNVQKNPKKTGGAKTFLQK